VIIRRLYISSDHNFIGHHGRKAGLSPMKEMTAVECAAGRGLWGDRFFDFKENYKGQITFFAQEVYEELCAQFGMSDREPSVFRRNVIVSGCDLNTLIGKKFELQGVLFEGTEEASPCYWMNQAFCEGAEAALRGRGGLRARILTDGMLQVS